MASEAETAAMRQAIMLSARGLGTASPNPPVGCVILDPHDRVVGTGFHRRKGESHAEVNALSAAGPAARGGTAVVTLEPCNHVGVTPACRQELLDAGIARVVVGLVDPTSRGDGGAAVLAHAGVDVEVGVLPDEVLTVLRPWLTATTRRKPHVTWAYTASHDHVEQTDASLLRSLRSTLDAIVSDDLIEEGTPGGHSDRHFHLAAVPSLKARQDLPSPRRPRQCMSRHELADGVNDALDELYPDEDLNSQYVDFRWVGKLERGEHRWPSEHRRAALRRVFGVSTDNALDLYSPRRTIGLYVPCASAARSWRTSDLANAEPSGGQVAVDAVLAAGEPDSVTTWLNSLDELRRALATQVDPNLEPRVQRHLDVLEHLQSNGSRSYLAIVDARWSEFMSWVSENLGALGAGQWLARARNRATQAADTTLTAYTLMRQSQRALLANDVRSAISLSREALASVPTSTRTEVL